MRALAILASVFVILSGCQTPKFTPPSDKYPTTKRIEATFAEVWEATLDTLFEEAPLSVVSREERLIATDWQYGKSDYAYHETAPFGLGAKEYMDSRWRMNVRLRGTGKSTIVAVKLIEEVREMRGGSNDDFAYSVWVPVESSTQRERKLLAEIAARVTGPGPSGQRARIEAKLDEMIEKKEIDKAIKYLQHEIEFNISDDELKKHFEERLAELEKEMKPEAPGQ